MDHWLQARQALPVVEVFDDLAHFVEVAAQEGQLGPVGFDPRRRQAQHAGAAVGRLGLLVAAHLVQRDGPFRHTYVASGWAEPLPPEVSTLHHEMASYLGGSTLAVAVPMHRDGELIGSIGRGYMVLMGVSDTDTEEITDKMVDKMCKLRIFEDENGKTNCSLADVDGEILLISQFTLYADCSHGNRPGFTGAGNPELANHLYEHALARCAGQVRKVEHGIFGADMKVELLNDGPFTILLDSDTIVKKK